MNNSLKSQFKSEKNASGKQTKAEFLISTKINFDHK
jgi:hypothetical protein